MLLRSHFGGLALIAGAIAAGVTFGAHAASSAAADLGPAAPITSTDPRHPVERYLVPPFLRDVAGAAQALHVTIYPEDQITIRPGIDYGLGGELFVTRALPVVVTDAGTPTTYRTWAGTVGELLAEQRVEVGDRDRVAPTADTPLAVNQPITITRVSVVEVTKTEVIGFATKTQDDPNRPRGAQATIQKGADGQRTLTYQVTRENGQEVGRKLTKTEVTKPPTDEIVAVGTWVVVLGTGKASWYNPPWSGLTAAHNTLPKGTIVDVVNVTTGKRVTVKINDRGIQTDAIIDLSPEAFSQLAPLGVGVIQVRLEVAG